MTEKTKCYCNKGKIYELIENSENEFRITNCKNLNCKYSINYVGFNIDEEDFIDDRLLFNYDTNFNE